MARSLAKDAEHAPRYAAWALELATKANSLEADNAHLLHTLGVAEYRAGHWQAAEHALTRSIELRTADQWAWRSLGHSFHAMAVYKQGHTGRARRSLGRAEQELGVIAFADLARMASQFQRGLPAAIRSLRYDEVAELQSADQGRPDRWWLSEDLQFKTFTEARRACQVGTSSFGRGTRAIGRIDATRCWGANQEATGCSQATASGPTPGSIRQKHLAFTKHGSPRRRSTPTSAERSCPR